MESIIRATTHSRERRGRERERMRERMRESQKKNEATIIFIKLRKKLLAIVADADEEEAGHLGSSTPTTLARRQM